MKVTYIKTRAFYDNNGGIHLGAGGQEAQTAAHELGHWLEDLDGEMHRKTIAFLERRTKGDKLERLRDLVKFSNYRPDEVTRKDQFASPYVGKVYARPTWKIRTNRPQGTDPFAEGFDEQVLAQQVYATEVLSMGIEYMVADAAKFARTDPDYFDFIYNLLRGL